jgi:hypothetical protein
MCGSKTRQAHFPQQQQQEQEQQGHVRSQEGWSSESGDGTARQAHPMKSTEDREIHGPVQAVQWQPMLLRSFS